MERVFKKRLEPFKRDANGEIIQDDPGRWWYGNLSKEEIEELIETGEAFFFSYKGRDYFIERCDGYEIADPLIDLLMNTTQPYFYLTYPGNEVAKTPEELMALSFLDGKTIFERFDELDFFDHSLDMTKFVGESKHITREEADVLIKEIAKNDRHLSQLLKNRNK